MNCFQDLEQAGTGPSRNAVGDSDIHPSTASVARFHLFHKSSQLPLLLARRGGLVLIEEIIPVLRSLRLHLELGERSIGRYQFVVAATLGVVRRDAPLDLETMGKLDLGRNELSGDTRDFAFAR